MLVKVFMLLNLYLLPLTLNPKPGLSQGDIRLDLYRISDLGNGGGNLLTSHTLESRNSFVTTTGDIYVSGEIWNTTSNVITLDPTKY